jgi:hypothetical protein
MICSTPAPAFVEMDHQIVWCSVATVDRAGRPRSRVLHPIWVWSEEALTGWVATMPIPSSGQPASGSTQKEASPLLPHGPPSRSRVQPQHAEPEDQPACNEWTQPSPSVPHALGASVSMGLAARPNSGVSVMR